MRRPLRRASTPGVRDATDPKREGRIWTRARQTAPSRIPTGPPRVSAHQVWPMNRRFRAQVGSEPRAAGAAVRAHSPGDPPWRRLTPNGVAKARHPLSGDRTRPSRSTSAPRSQGPSCPSCDDLRTHSGASACASPPVPSWRDGGIFERPSQTPESGATDKPHAVHIPDLRCLDAGWGVQKNRAHALPLRVSRDAAGRPRHSGRAT